MIAFLELKVILTHLRLVLVAPQSVSGKLRLPRQPPFLLCVLALVRALNMGENARKKEVRTLMHHLAVVRYVECHDLDAFVVQLSEVSRMGDAQFIVPNHAMQARAHVTLLSPPPPSP